MAEKRMFSKKITDSDSFIEMGSAAQALYFHLNQGADDDGFNNQIQIAMLKAHASTDDLKVLMAKNFIIRFESGVIVIKHWRVHNTLRKDRYTATNFQDELRALGIKDNGSYSLLKDSGCQTVAKRLPQIRIDKYRLDKIRLDKSNKYIKAIFKSKKPIANDSSSLLETIKKIVDYLNLKTNSNFRYSNKATQRKIKARLDEGYILDDFIVVINKKTKEWLNNAEFNKYLCPETLFGTKFEKYLNQKVIVKGQSLDSISMEDINDAIAREMRGG